MLPRRALIILAAFVSVGVAAVSAAWAFSNPTVGTACPGPDSQSFWEQSSICPQGTLVWQRPAFQFGASTSQTCDSGLAGMVQWTGTAASPNNTLQYCNGSGWTDFAAASSGILLGSSATATNPQKSGDAGTGLFSATAGGVGIATAGVQRLIVNMDGNVRIEASTGTVLSLHTACTGCVHAGLNLNNIRNNVGTGNSILFSSPDASSATKEMGRITSVMTNNTANSANADIYFSTNYLGTVGEKIRITSIGNLGIGTATPRTSLDAGYKTDALILQSGTTGERPASPAVGMVRYNTTTNAVEAYTGSSPAWASLLSGSLDSGVILGTSATANNPQATGDVNTGLFSATASTVSVATAGVERLTVTATGGVGVGTNSPVSSYQLTVSGPSSGIYAQSTATGSVALYAIGSSNSSGAARFNSNVGSSAVINSDTYGSYAIVGKFSTYGTAGYGLYVLSSGPNAAGGVFIVSGINGVAGSFNTTATSATNYAIRTSVAQSSDYSVYAAGGRNYFSGSIGIATATPRTSLDAGFNTDALILQSGTTGERPASPAVGMVRYNTTTNAVEAYTGSSPAWASLLSGSLGSGVILGTSATANNPQATGDVNTGLFSATASTVSVATAGVERLTVTATGSVGIGTAAPETMFHVRPDFSVIKVGHSGATDVRFNLQTANTSGGWTLIAKSTTGSFSIDEEGHASRFTIMKTTGNTGINTEVPRTTLDLGYNTDALVLQSGTTGERPASPVNGMIRYNTTTGAFEFYESNAWVNHVTASDARMKTNVSPITGALDMVQRLRPVFFEWDKNTERGASKDDRRHVGFLAQEIEEVLPEVVRVGGDGYRTVDYGSIVTVAVGALKETKAEIEALKASNRKLEQKIMALMAANDNRQGGGKAESRDPEPEAGAENREEWWKNRKTIEVPTQRRRETAR